MFEIIIAILALSFLIIFHELGHFIPAKKFGTKVEEFGLGFGPRLFGRKIGETLFSFNLLPLGGFVKIFGEEEHIKDSRSFTGKPIWQRALIIIGGVVIFWIIAAILLSIVFGLGAPTPVGDEENEGLVDPKVQIAAVTQCSPAEEAGLEVGDIIRELKIANEKPAPYRNEISGAGLKITRVKEVQEFTDLHKGKEITLTIQRGKEIFEVSLTPRPDPPEKEGAMGVALVRTVIKTYPWYQAPFQGILATGRLAILIVDGLGQILTRVFKGEPLPPGAEVMGPVGVVGFMGERLGLGITYFLHFIAVIAVYLAIFNLLPIPALDGGKLLFLGIEAIRKKPIPQKIEQNITAIFFILFIALIIFITVGDIQEIMEPTRVVC